jgi:hypothetical protein
MAGDDDPGEEGEDAWRQDGRADCDGPMGVPAAVARLIGEHLCAMYAQVLREPVPPRLEALLRDLAARGPP